MTSTSLHPTPSSQTVAKEEFRAVGLAIRTEAFYFLGALLLFIVLILSAVRFAHTPHAIGAHGAFSYHASSASAMFLVGLLIPFGVWRSEDPARRAYFWSTPVARGPHTVMKILSGWGWLMIATALYLLFLIIIGIAVPLIGGGPAWRATAPAWEWVAAFTASTLGYLLTSIVVVASDHPWRWIGGVVLGYAVLLGVFSSFGLRELASALNALVGGQYGLGAALFGGGDSMASWIFAMLLWVICSAIAVTIAAYRHHE